MPEEDYLRPSPVRFDEPSYQSVYDYWQRLRADRRSPAWREWDWMEIAPGYIPFFMVVDVLREPLDFVYRFYGTASVEMHRKDFTGLSVKEIRTPVAARKTFDQYEEVVTLHEAIGSKYVIQAGADGPPYVQTSLRMPFSDNGEDVTHIATYLDWSKDFDKIREENRRRGSNLLQR